MEKKSYTYEEIKQKLVNYCVYQDRCHAEVAQKMRDFLLIPEAEEEIVMYLIQENYLNEERFAKSYARGKFYIKQWGRQKIKMHLKAKGINERLIQTAMMEIDEGDYDKCIDKLYHKHYDATTKTTDFVKANKAIKYLISRGFEYENIKKIANI